VYKFGSLGIFLILGYIVPGITIFAALIVFIPTVGALVVNWTAYELIAASLLICFFTGHVGFLVETMCIKYIWMVFYKKLRSKDLTNLFFEKSQLFVEAEFFNIPHTHIDQIFGEFVLFTNTSIALFCIGIFRIIDHLTINFRHIEYLVILMNGTLLLESYDTLSDITIILLSSMVLFFTAPLYKLRLIDMLQTLKRLLAEKRQSLELASNDKEKKMDCDADDDELDVYSDSEGG
jgi:hypothetical protein